MNEIGKYQVYKEKLQGVCDENDLTFSIQNKKYPFMMTVKPISGLDAQMDMLEEMGENGGTGEDGDTGYISPDASIVFAYNDGNLTYKTSETFTISDALFSKLKNLFKKLHDMWMMYFFRDVIASGRLNAEGWLNSDADRFPGGQQGEESTEDEEEPTEEEPGAEDDVEPDSEDECSEDVEDTEDEE